jgi:fatty-acyl-CoA synthase
VEARVVAEDGRDCSTEEVGELWLRSDVVTPGYWRRPEETAATITDGWFHTGDMVRRDPEGFYFVVDRKKNMFISGGENVYPAEVEEVLVRYPAVREAAVVGVPDAKWGEVGKAFIVLEEGRQAAEEEILSHCRANLAGYKIPKQVEFITQLPRNEAGKVDRRALETGPEPKQKGP